MVLFQASYEEFMLDAQATASRGMHSTINSKNAFILIHHNNLNVFFLLRNFIRQIVILISKFQHAKLLSLSFRSRLRRRLTLFENAMEFHQINYVTWWMLAQLFTE